MATEIEGKIEGKIEVAEQLLRRGIMTPPEISEITGLPLEQVSRLQEENSQH
jgi:predicted transposase YdaD